MGGFLENRGHPEVSPCLLDRRSRALTVCVKPVGGGGGVVLGSEIERSFSSSRWFLWPQRCAGCPRTSPGEA